jgi:hypothetical protein
MSGKIFSFQFFTSKPERFTDGGGMLWRMFSAASRLAHFRAGFGGVGMT